MVTGNLLGASRVSGELRSHAIRFRVARDLQQFNEIPRDALLAVVLDLEGPVDAATLAASLGEMQVERVAFGPHVDTERLAAAEAAGWNVMSRGSFDSAVGDLARQWAELAR